jgi:thiamine transport system permease protein
VLTLGSSPEFNTLEVAIYEAVRFDFDLPRAFQLAMIQIIICIILVMLASTKVGSSTSVSVRRAPRYRYLYSSGENIFQRCVIALFALFFITPLIAVLIDGTGPQLISIFSKKGFQSALINSILIAAASTLLAMSLAVVIASATVTLSSPARLNQVSTKLSVLSSTILAKTLGKLISISAMLYLVFPALVMGLGFFLLHQSLGGNPVVWAACVVTIANALISIPFAVAVLRPAIQGAAIKHDRLCASLGLGRWTRWCHIDWPALKSDVTYSAALAFCFSLGDLGVIALFGSDEFRTLPWLLYQNFGSYRTHDASAIALILLILVIGVFWVAQASTASAAKEHSS